MKIGALYHDERTPASAGLGLVYHRVFQFAPEGSCHAREVTSTCEARTRQTYSGPSLPTESFTTHYRCRQGPDYTEGDVCLAVRCTLWL